MYLNQAKFVFADIMMGWDTTCCGANPGGIWWHKPNDGRGYRNQCRRRDFRVGAVQIYARYDLSRFREEDLCLLVDVYG